MAKSTTATADTDVLELSDERKRIISGFNRKSVYMLVEENTSDGVKIYDARTSLPIRGPRFRDYTNLILKSTIIWDGSDHIVDEKTHKTISGHPAGMRQILYYDGCTTIFRDEQPQEKAVIDQYIQRTQPRFFQHGFITVYGHETLLKKFLDMDSRNANSPYRINTISAQYHVSDAEAVAKTKKKQQDLEDRAVDLAKEATSKHMRMHCLILQIGDQDFMTGVELSDEAIRVEYRSAAKADPVQFIKTYEDKGLEIKYMIRKCLDNGTLSTVKIPGKLCWTKSGQVVLDVSGHQDPQKIIDKAAEYSQTFDGQDFLLQLKGSAK